MEEFAIDDEFKPYQVAITRIEEITEVRFDALVLAAGALAHEKPAHRREINKLEDVPIS